MQPGRADDRHQHDVRIRAGGEVGETFVTHPHFHPGRQQGAEGGFLGGIVDGHLAGAGGAGLRGELCDVGARGQSGDGDPVRQAAGHLERGASDRAGGP
jgi:hypothetical protein